MNTPAEASAPRLSVAMIVCDEQEVLAASIESVRPLADEIVVLDTGSTDRTVELAKRLGATVYKRPLARSFAAARNHCSRFVSGSWVLWLDAGERLASESMKPLAEFLRTRANPQEVYSLYLETPPREPTASAEQVALPRLMPTAASLEFEGRVRETIGPSLRAAGLATAIAPGRILRHPRQHDHDRAVAKARRDLALATLEAEESGQWPARLLLAAGEAQSVLGQFDQARETLAQAVFAARCGSAEMLEAYYGLLAALDDTPELQAIQLSTCLDALETFPLDIQLLVALGNYLLTRGNFALAIRTFDAAVRFGKITPAVWHLTGVREIAAVCLSVALQGGGRADDACHALEAALAEDPDSRRLLVHLADLYRKLGKGDQAQAIAARIAAMPTGGQSLSVSLDGGRNLRVDSATTGGDVPAPTSHFFGKKEEKRRS